MSTLSPAKPIPSSSEEQASTPVFRLSHFVPIKVKRRGVEMRIILGGQSQAPRVDPALLKAIARARCWFEEVASGRVQSLVEIARREGLLSKRYVTRLARLAFVSPVVAVAVAAGRAPAAINLQILMDGRQALPVDWKDQQLTL